MKVTENTTPQQKYYCTFGKDPEKAGMTKEEKEKDEWSSGNISMP